MNDEFYKGVACFNQGKFYEAHEHWEKIWLKTKGEGRLFYQGIIQLAACGHHFKRGKIKEANQQFNKANEKLNLYSENSHGVNVDQLLFDMREWIEGRQNQPKI